MSDRVDDDGCLSSVLQRPFLATIQVIPVTDFSVVSLLALFCLILDVLRLHYIVYWRSIKTLHVG